MVRSKSRLAQFWRVLLFNVVLAGVAILVLELIFGDWLHAPSTIDRLNLIRDSTLRFDASALYDRPEPIVYSRDEWALRGAYPSPGNIDIVTLGGSATDQRYIGDGETWQAVIAREFAAEGRTVSVVNAGVDGQSTFGHIKDFDWWFPTIPDFRPRYVLFYISGNDIYKDDDSSFDDLLNEKSPSWKTTIKERSVMYRVLYTLRGIYQARQVHRISHRRDAFDEWVWTQQPLAANHRELAAARLVRYRKAVAMLAGRARKLRATPIFVTQSLAAYRIAENGKIEGRMTSDPYDDALINGMDLYVILREFWRVTMEECAKAEGICIDAGNEIQWQPGDFYDSIHNTPQGAERLGKYLHQELRELPLSEHADIN